VSKALEKKRAALLGNSSKRFKGGGSRKFGRNREKCKRYRQRVGKPNGPGQDGRKT
jgi:hypothetical protein